MDSEKRSENFEGVGMGGWGHQVVGIVEGTDCMEHWVWCKNNEYCYAENNNNKKEQDENQNKIKERKDEYPTFVATWTGLEEIMLSEISQAETVNCHMVSLICGA